MAVSNPYEAWLEATRGQERLPKGRGLPGSGTVELSDPARIPTVWRGVLATILVMAGLALVALGFLDNAVVADPSPGIEWFAGFAGGCLIGAVILALGFGTVKLSYQPTADDPTTEPNKGEDDSE